MSKQQRGGRNVGTARANWRFHIDINTLKGRGNQLSITKHIGSDLIEVTMETRGFWCQNFETLCVIGWMCVCNSKQYNMCQWQQLFYSEAMINNELFGLLKDATSLCLNCSHGVSSSTRQSNWIHVQSDYFKNVPANCISAFTKNVPALCNESLFHAEIADHWQKSCGI